MRKRLDKPYQLKADLKRGQNQYLATEIYTKNCQLDKAKIVQAG